MRQVLGWLVAGAAAASMPASASAQTLDVLYEAAKGEGALALVGGGPAPP